VAKKKKKRKWKTAPRIRVTEGKNVKFKVLRKRDLSSLPFTSIKSHKLSIKNREKREKFIMLNK